MSSELVHSALEFVDQQEGKTKANKRRFDTSHQSVRGQVSSDTPKQRYKKQKINSAANEETEKGTKKLLGLSSSTTISSILDKIIERAIKGKPEKKIEVKIDEQKYIIFPKET